MSHEGWLGIGAAMSAIKIILTDNQRRLLAPLFAQVRAGNKESIDTAIMAQILPDGMIVKAVSGDALNALMAALGSDPAARQRSVKGH
jgi:hypothetical protein